MVRKLNLGCGLAPEVGAGWLNADVLRVDLLEGWPEGAAFLQMDVVSAMRATMERFELVRFCHVLEHLPLEMHPQVAWQINGLLVMGGMVEVYYPSAGDTFALYTEGRMSLRQLTSHVFDPAWVETDRAFLPMHRCLLDSNHVREVFEEEGFERRSRESISGVLADGMTRLAVFRKVGELHDMLQRAKGARDGCD